MKLHGDYLFDDLKNTEKELASLRESMKHRVRQVAEEYGLVVCGYAGNDESVMTPILDLLSTPQSFPNGIYWCTLPSGFLPDRLVPYEDTRVFHIKSSGFDELMADTFSAMRPGEQPEAIRDPAAFIASRLSHLVPRATNPSPPSPSTRLNKDVAKVATWSQSLESPTAAIPHNLSAWIFYRQEDYRSAIRHYLETIKGRVFIHDLLVFFECLRHHWDERAYTDLKAFLDRTAHDPTTPTNWLNAAVLSLIHAEKYKEAREICSLAANTLDAQNAPEHLADFIRLNELQIVVHSKSQLTPAEKAEVREIALRRNFPECRFGCHVLLDEHQEAMQVVAAHPESFNSDTLDWPIVDLLAPALRNALEATYGPKGWHIGKLEMQFQIQFATPPKS